MGHNTDIKAICLLLLSICCLYMPCAAQKLELLIYIDAQYGTSNATGTVLDPLDSFKSAVILVSQYESIPLTLVLAPGIYKNPSLSVKESLTIRTCTECERSYQESMPVIKIADDAWLVSVHQDSEPTIKIQGIVITNAFGTSKDTLEMDQEEVTDIEEVKENQFKVVKEIKEINDNRELKEIETVKDNDIKKREITELTEPIYVLQLKDAFVELKDLIIQDFCRNTSLIRLSSGSIADFRNVTAMNNTMNLNALFGNGGAVVDAGSGSLEIHNSRFVNNTVFTSGPGASQPHGGGVIITRGPLQVYDSLFADNTAYFKSNYAPPSSGGGAIFSYTTAELLIASSRFLSNSVRYMEESKHNGLDGGAVLTSGSQKAMIQDCFFYNNTADIGGAVSFGETALYAPGNAYIVNTIFEANTGTIKGGAISSTTQGVGTLTVEHSSIIGNHGQDSRICLHAYSVKGYGGAGISITKQGTPMGMLLINNVTFMYNYAFGSECTPVFAGGALLARGLSVIEINNSTFSHNIAEFDGVAIWIRKYFSLKIQGNQFFNNTASLPLRPTTFKIRGTTVDIRDHSRLNAGITALQSETGNKVLKQKKMADSKIETCASHFVPLAPTCSLIDLDRYPTILVNNTFGFHVVSEAMLVIHNVPKIWLLKNRASGISNIDAFSISEAVLVDIQRVRGCVLVSDWVSEPTVRHSFYVASVDNLEIYHSKFSSSGLLFSFKDGALSLYSVTQAYLNHVEFLDNRMSPLQAEFTSLYMENCWFHHNNESAVFKFSPATFYNTTWSSNSALSGAFTTNRATNIWNSTAVDNKGVDGGAINLKNAVACINYFNCTRNNALYGGCIFVVGESSGAYIRHSLFEKNSAGIGGGGAIVAMKKAKMEIINSDFFHNKCVSNGGAILLDQVRATLKNNTFGWNHAEPIEDEAMPSDPPSLLQGASVGLGGAIHAVYSSLVVQNSKFYNNSAIRGGAILEKISATGTFMFVDASEFSNNLASVAGGAISLMFNAIAPKQLLKESSKEPLTPKPLKEIILLINSSFDENFAWSGGAVDWSFLNQPMPISASINGCSFNSNNAVYGGVIYAMIGALAMPQMHHLIVTNNRASAGAVLFYYHTPDPYQVPNLPRMCNSSMDCSYSGNQATFWGDRKASSDFEFILDDWSNNADGFDTSPVDITDVDTSLNVLSMVTNRTTQIEENKREEKKNIVPKLYPGMATGTYHYVDLYGQAVEDDWTSEFSFTTSTETGKLVMFTDVTHDPHHQSFHFQLALYKPKISPVFPSLKTVVTTLNVRSSRPVMFRDRHLVLQFEIEKCPIGQGMSPLTSPEWYTCTSCLFGTVNFNGDGECHVCDSAMVKCPGYDQVLPLEGYWVFAANSSYEMYIHACLNGYCNENSCAPGREGPLCGSCSPGWSESLMLNI